MRAVLILLISMMGIGSAAAEEWVSRTGYCFEWEGSWAVNRERSGLVGRQDRIHPRRRALRQSDTSGGRAACAGGHRRRRFLRCPRKLSDEWPFSRHDDSGRRAMRRQRGPVPDHYRFQRGSAAIVGESARSRHASSLARGKGWLMRPGIGRDLSIHISATCPLRRVTRRSMRPAISML